jgi:hypothetical protein
MKLLLTGCTGFVGQVLGKRLVQAGHQCVVLTRNPEKARRNSPFPAEFHKWDALKGAPKAKVFNGIEGVINLAGENIAAKRWTKARKKALWDSRILALKHLREGMKDAGIKPSVFISASAIGYYGEAGDKILTEDSAKGSGFLSDLCEAWEAEAKIIKEISPETRLFIPRIGVVAGRGGGFLNEIMPLFKKGLGGPIGFGKHWMSWIHREDLAQLLVSAISDSKMEGIANAVAPGAVRNKEFTKALAKAVGMPALFPAPRVALKIAFGELSELLLSSQRVEPEKLKESGFQFKYPDIQSALNAVVPTPGSHDELLVAEQWVSQPIEEVFEFYKDANNLERITPPWLSFNVQRVSTDEMQDGTEIEYKLKIRGLPIRWVSLIKEWSEPDRFVDTQIKGPYKRWYHRHEFERLGNGTLVRDHVEYSVPLGVLGKIFALPLVEKDVKTIFAYRNKVTHQIFEEANA